MSRNIKVPILAAVLAAGTAGAALADVQVKAPGVEVKAPGVDLNVNVGAKPSPSKEWIDRAVYSIDGKHIGEIAAIAKDQVYADVGGFLGIGETRVLLDMAQIAEVKNDRIVLRMTEAEVKNLPPVDKTPVVPQ